MDRDDPKQRRSPAPRAGQQVGTSQSGAAPGKRTPTARLSASTDAPVQRKPAAQGGDRWEMRETVIDDWSPVICRPDLYNQPIQRTILLPHRVATPKGESEGDGEGEAQAALSGTSAAAAERALGALPAGGGAALDAGLAARVEQSTGQALPDVRVHTGPASARAAHAIQARAFTVGSNIHLGRGESPADTQLMAHEAAHTLQQAGGAVRAKGVSSPDDAFEREADQVAAAVLSGGVAPVTSGAGGKLQRDVRTDVEGLLSYSATDWAVTDEEAVDALSRLAALSQPQLTTVLAGLDQEYKTRLLDNLPDSAKQTSGYTKVLVALGPAAVRPYLQDLLSYGLFDWAVTDQDAQQVFRIILAMDATGQAAIATQLGTLFRARLADNLQRAATIGAAEQACLRVLFDNTPAAEQDTLAKWFTLRFRVPVGAASGSRGIQWDKPGLTRAWDVLQALPPEHVENNPNLGSLVRYNARSIEGWASDDGTAAMGYGASNNIDTTTETGAFTDPGDPMQGTNMFDATVRHEIGHRVDPSVNGSDGYCRTAGGGEWLDWSDGSGMAAVMVAASAGAIHTWTDAAEKATILQTLQGVIDDRAPDELDDRLEAMAFVADHDTDPAQQDKLDQIQGDKVITALKVCFSSNEPWHNAGNGGVALGGRVYQEAYEDREWVSYKQDARTRKVSTYQFRAHWEWFAEAYAAYYEPAATKGAVLAARDPATKAWFDANVEPAGASAAGTGSTGAGAGTGGSSATP